MDLEGDAPVIVMDDADIEKAAESASPTAPPSLSW